MAGFSGRVVTGKGEAARFTGLVWVHAWFLRELGIDPYPGTLNVMLDDEVDRRGWDALRADGSKTIAPPDPCWCSALCYAVRVNGTVPAAIVSPQVANYPSNQAEIVAAISLRASLSLTDGEQVRVVKRGPLRVRALIFDVDGTLVDSLKAFRVVAERAAAPYGILITDEMIRDALNTSRHFWDLAIPTDRDDRAATLAALSREAARMWPDVLREHGRVYDDVAPVLQALRDRGLRLGIMTGSRRGSIQPLQDAGLIDLFDAVITGDQVRRRKPDPEGLLMCAKALDVLPRDAVYVGDTVLDVQAARAAGMASVGVLTGGGDSAGLSLCGVNHIVSTLDRLVSLVAVGL